MTVLRWKTFQRLLRVRLGGLNWENYETMTDAILIFIPNILLYDFQICNLQHQLTTDSSIERTLSFQDDI